MSRRRILAIGLGLVLAVPGLGVVAGSFLPRDHVAACRARFSSPPETIWALLADFEGQPAWRSGLERVERLPDRDGHPVIREHGSFGPVTFEIVEMVPGRRLVGRIADEDLGFGGTWTWELAPSGEGCSVTVTERGRIDSPLFRFLARFAFGYHGTLETYLGDLGRKLGETPAVERLPGHEEKQRRFTPQSSKCPAPPCAPWEAPGNATIPGPWGSRAEPV